MNVVKCIFMHLPKLGKFPETSIDDTEKKIV